MIGNEGNRDVILEGAEKVSLRKIRWLFSKYWIWLIAILFATNTLAYLYIRWTKPVYQATSEIKLDVESDATEFGIGTLIEDKNLGILSGEIELIKSRLFFQKVLDTLDLSVSYYTQGRILMEEKYPSSPFEIEYTINNPFIIDQKIFFEFKSPETFVFYLENQSESEIYHISDQVEDENLSFSVNTNPSNIDLTQHKFVVIINSRESLQDYLDANLNVSLLNLKANTLKISFSDYNPVKARDIVNTINEIYINYTQEEKSRANRNKIDWINHQLENIESDLSEFENYFEDFTIENRTNDLDADLKTTVRQINVLDSQQYEISRRINIASELISKVDSNTILSPSRLLPEEINNNISNLNNQRIERERLGISYKESTFTIQSKDKEINTMASAVKELLVEYNENLNVTLKNTDDKKKQLERSFTQIPGKTTEFNKKQRFYKLYEEFYLSLMQSKAEFEIAVAGITPNFTVLEPAKISPTPVSPNKMVVQSGGVISGVIACFFLITALYVIEDKINSVEEMEELLPYPVIGNIPRTRHKNSDGSLVSDQHPKSGVSEALRTTRTNIQFIVPENKSQVLSISSSVAGEGKSFIASNISAILAASNKKVCLIDLDMRKPTIHTTFGKGDNETGISTLLINQTSVENSIVESTLSNLHYIPSGPIPPNPSELISNGGFRELIKKLKSSYDFIIMDTPPIGLVTDGILAMKESDLALLVVRYGYTRKKDVKSTLRNLKMVDTKIGLMFNSHETGGDYGYTKGYYTDKTSS